MFVFRTSSYYDAIKIYLYIKDINLSLFFKHSLGKEIHENTFNYVIWSVYLVIKSSFLNSLFIIFKRTISVKGSERAILEN